MKLFNYLKLTSLVIVFSLVFAISSSGKTQDFGKEANVKLEQVSDILAYNVRMTLRLNGKIIATPELTMIAGKGTLIAKGHDENHPYKLIVTLLDGPEILTRFPQMKLQSFFENRIFMETNLYMPEFRSQPTEQWRKIASPGLILKTDGQIAQIKTNASSLGFNIPTNSAKAGELLQEVSWGISVFPTQATE